jgi:hypothetical protein
VTPAVVWRIIAAASRVAVSFSGVEQAFMPAVTWHPLPALAAEVSLSGYINLGCALGAFFKDLFDHSFSLGPVIPSPNPRFF